MAGPLVLPQRFAFQNIYLKENQEIRLTREIIQIISFELIGKIFLWTCCEISKDGRDWHILTANDQRIISHNLKLEKLLFKAHPKNKFHSGCEKKTKFS